MAELSQVIDTPPADAEPAGQFVTYPGSPFQLFQPYPPAAISRPRSPASSKACATA